MSDEASRAAEIRLSIDIAAPTAIVWAALTDPDLMARWMLDSRIEVHSGRRVGSPIVIRGDLHGIPFENRGTILAFEPGRVFQYDYWSTLSFPVIPDAPENYSTVRFELHPIEAGTRLALTLGRFVDDSVPRHARLYWTGTLPTLREFCERRDDPRGLEGDREDGRQS